MSNGNPAAHGADPLAAAATATASPTTSPLPPDLPDVWKKRFALIERAGGLKMTRFKDLSFGERMRCNFNLLAGLFGPIYYATKGMWKRGLTYVGLGLAGIIMLETLITLAGFGHVLDGVHYTGAWIGLFGYQANRDYYKKIVLGDNRWL